MEKIEERIYVLSLRLKFLLSRRVNEASQENSGASKTTNAAKDWMKAL